MTTIGVTGAGGNVGRQTLKALEETDHDIKPITHSEHDDIDSELMELTDEASVMDAIAGCDVVFHYAAIATNADTWAESSNIDIDGTQRVYAAAVEHDVDRVVYASSNHAVQFANANAAEDKHDLVEQPEMVRPDDPVRPDGFYGITKVAGEALGTYYADRHGIEVINLRIGWLLTLAELEAKQDEDIGLYARAQWLSPRDCRDAARKAATVDIPRNPLTVHLVSRNQERYLSIGEAMRGLGYRPKDDSSEALDI